MLGRNGKKGLHLTPEELAEFKLRRAALDQARCTFMMMEEEYVAWTRTVKEKYNLPSKYDIDIRTGVLTPKND